MNTLAGMRDRTIPMLASVTTYMLEGQTETAHNILKCQRSQILNEVNSMRSKLTQALNGIANLKRQNMSLDKELQLLKEEDISFSQALDGLDGQGGCVALVAVADTVHDDSQGVDGDHEGNEEGEDKNKAEAIEEEEEEMATA